MSISMNICIGDIINKEISLADFRILVVGKTITDLRYAGFGFMDAEVNAKITGVKKVKYGKGIYAIYLKLSDGRALVCNASTKLVSDGDNIQVESYEARYPYFKGTYITYLHDLAKEISMFKQEGNLAALRYRSEIELLLGGTSKMYSTIVYNLSKVSESELLSILDKETKKRVLHGWAMASR